MEIMTRFKIWFGFVLLAIPLELAFRPFGDGGVAAFAWLVAVVVVFLILMFGALDA